MNPQSPMPTGERRRDTCDIHGAFESRHLFRNTWSKCSVCAAEKAAKDEAERDAIERQATTERWQRRLGHSGIPARFQEKTFEAFVATSAPQKKALAAVAKYAEDVDRIVNSGKSLVLIGRPGTGKTHLAAAVGLRAMEAGWNVLFSTTMRAISRIKATWDRNAAETEKEAIGLFSTAHLLILDEVGVQFGSATEKNLLFDIINSRYEHRLPTILISNLDIAGVTSFLGERVMDRLREDSGEVVVFNWASYRGNAQ